MAIEFNGDFHSGNKENRKRSEKNRKQEAANACQNPTPKEITDGNLKSREAVLLHFWRCYTPALCKDRHTLHFLFHDQPGEVFKRPVIRLFGIRRKKASWYLSLGEVILDAIATDSQPGAGRVCAGAKRLVSFEFFAFHENSRVDKTKLSSIRASSNRHVKSRICVDGGNVADTDIAKIRPNLYDSS